MSHKNRDSRRKPASFSDFLILGLWGSALLGLLAAEISIYLPRENAPAAPAPNPLGIPIGVILGLLIILSFVLIVRRKNHPK